MEREHFLWWQQLWHHYTLHASPSDFCLWCVTADGTLGPAVCWAKAHFWPTLPVQPTKKPGSPSHTVSPSSKRAEMSQWRTCGLSMLCSCSCCDPQQASGRQENQGAHPFRSSPRLGKQSHKTYQWHNCVPIKLHSGTVFMNTNIILFGFLTF